jgi:hypothetical protein
MNTNRKVYTKSKKGISVIVGYVLLITFTVVIGFIVYNWMNTYIPQEELNCPDGTSLLIQNYSCSSDILSITLENNGNFDIGGYFIYATDSPEEELATIDLSKNNTQNYSIRTPSGVKFGFIGEKNSLGPNEKETETYNITNRDTIYLIQIIPMRWQEEKNKEVVVTCKDIQIEKRVEC